MKGASNRYGNTRGSKGRGIPSEHINYAWAKAFNKNSLQHHFEKHASSVNASQANEYEYHAVKFANMIDRKNHVSFVDRHGSTYKYSKLTNEFVIVKSNGIIVTYFKPKDGYNYYKNAKEFSKK